MMVGKLTCFRNDQKGFFRFISFHRNPLCWIVSTVLNTNSNFHHRDCLSRKISFINFIRETLILYGKRSAPRRKPSAQIWVRSSGRFYNIVSFATNQKLILTCSANNPPVFILTLIGRQNLLSVFASETFHRPNSISEQLKVHNNKNDFLYFSPPSTSTMKRLQKLMKGWGIGSTPMSIQC